MTFDWNPLDSPVFKAMMPVFEGITLASTYLISPSITAAITNEMGQFNQSNGIQNPFGLDMNVNHSSTMTNFIAPTAELVGTGIVAYINPVAGAAVAAVLPWAQSEVGIANSESSYSQWARWVGLGAGSAANLYQAWAASSAATAAAAGVGAGQTPSPSADAGYNPGTGANTNPITAAAPAAVTSSSFLSTVQQYQPYFQAAQGIYSMYNGLTAKTTTPSGSGSTGAPTAAAPGAGVNMASIGFIAILFVAAARKISQ